MRTYKPMYRDRCGHYKKIKRWWVALRDHTRTMRQFPAFTNKAASESLGRQLEKLVAAKISGGSLEPQLARWLKEIPTDLRERLVKVGLIDPKEAAAGKPLKEHIEDFEKSLLAKGRAEKHIRQVRNVLIDVFNACGFIYWHDISANSLESYLADLRDRGRGISARTFNHKLKCCQQFARWMVKNRRAAESPIAHLSCLNVKLDRRRKRRALMPEDIKRLLSATRNSVTRFGLSGFERYLVYRLCVETGLRASEVRGLKVSDFDLENLTVSVQAAYAKNRRDDVLPLRSDTMAELRAYLSGKLPNHKAFDVPLRTADMLKEDLAEAGIPYVADNLYFDFHALRHETGTLLAAGGVHPKTAQSIMRHSDINLTMTHYTHTLTGQEAEAIAKLPDFSVPKDDEKAKQQTA